MWIYNGIGHLHKVAKKSYHTLTLCTQDVPAHKSLLQLFYL